MDFRLEVAIPSDARELASIAISTTQSHGHTSLSLGQRHEAAIKIFETDILTQKEEYIVARNSQSNDAIAYMRLILNSKTWCEHEDILPDWPHQQPVIIQRREIRANIRTLRKKIMSGTGHFYLRNIAVSPQWRGRGVGSALVARAKSLARASVHTLPIYLDSDADVCDFYIKQGFVEVESIFMTINESPSDTKSFHAMVWTRSGSSM
ncbi:hypothetical protein N7456_002310 [Penicillium angulare]|uniref:N-acetyltransferase domain-containing protein n=1 Tax=Penicillium angulare TaxID=116970 RepID=A0A9W9KQ51_9EURO|nr:hypothetical protein N7456_002310 [Penicillium angulare]